MQLIDKKAYGAEPFQVITLHGGPGGIGDIANLAEFISSFASVLEPFMIEKSINDQVQKLAQYIKVSPAIVGYSWGAIMAILFTNKFPNCHCQ